MPVNRSLSPLRSYGRNFVAMPLVLRGTGVGSDMEAVSGPPGTLVSGPDGGGFYTVQLPGEGAVSHIVATGHTSLWGGNTCFIDSMTYDPPNRIFTFRVADYSGGGVPIVLAAAANDIATFSIFVDNK